MQFQDQHVKLLFFAGAFALSYHRPFLKWAGNKYHILKQLKAVLPTGKRLIEPFTGSGAVFLNFDYPDYLLAEKNPDLINLYLCLQKEGDLFIEFARSLVIPKNNQAKRYYEFRDLFNETTEPLLRSALFIYLNRHGYNGLCRYNQQGYYNVPFGRYKNPIFPEASLKKFYERSQHVKFICQDFQKTFELAKPGDVIYCDPPYVPLSKTAHFTNYHQHNFTMADQEKLIECAKKAAKNGVVVVISNHDCPFVRKTYKPAKIKSFLAPRRISREASTRKPVKEILARFN